MRSITRLVVPAMFVAGLFCAVALAQEAPEDVIVRVELVDGSVLIGTVVQETDEAIVLRTAAGLEVSVPRAQIRRMAAFEGRIEDGQVILYDPNRTRLLFSPTARPLGRGEGYLAVYQVFVPFVGYGVTDQVSIAGGTVLFPGAFGRVWYVAPKVTLLEQPNLSVALGAVGLGVFVEDETTTGGIGYGLVTYGGQTSAVTLGAGFAVAEGGLSSGVIITLGGEHQVSNSVKLITENYALPISTETWNPTTGEFGTETQYEFLIGVGVRFFGQRLAVDLAGFTSPGLLGEDLFPFIPWVGFAYNF